MARRERPSVPWARKSVRVRWSWARLWRISRGAIHHQATNMPLIDPKATQTAETPAA